MENRFKYSENFKQLMHDVNENSDILHSENKSLLLNGFETLEINRLKLFGILLHVELDINC